MGSRPDFEASPIGRRNSPISTRQRNLSFGGFAEHFLSVQKRTLSAASLVRLRSIITELAAFFGDTTTLASITEDQVRRFIRLRSRDVSLGVLRHELSALKRIFRMAVEMGIVESHPAFEFVAPRERVTTRHLTKEAFARVLKFCPEWLKPISLFAVGAGLSRKELLALTWECLDEADNQIRLRPSEGKEGRVIPLNKMATLALRMVRAQADRPTGRVFRGKSVTEANISQSFMRACRLAEVHASFKDLRHTSATWMLEQGVSLQAVADFLGHSNVQASARYLNQSHQGVSVSTVKAIDRAARLTRPD